MDFVSSPLIASKAASLALSHPIITSLSILVASRVIYLLYFHPLANVPGPTIAKLTDAWRAYHIARGTYAPAVSKAHDKYGKAVRIGSNEVSLVEPSQIKDIYANFNSEFMKGPFYGVWNIVDVNHFSDRNPKTHAARRRNVANAWSLNSLLTLEDFVDQLNDQIKDKFDAIAGGAQVTDLSDWINYYAFDAVADIGLGQSFKLLEQGADPTGMLVTLPRATLGINIAACFHNFGWLVNNQTLKKFGFNLLGDKGPQLFVSFVEKLVDARYKRVAEGDNDRQDMLYRFMQCTDAATGQKLTKHQIMNDASTLAVAGADTTAVTMKAFLKYVYSNKAILTRLRQEIDDAMASGKLSLPFQYAACSKLDYLQACIKETLRMHPAVGMTMQRIVPQGGRQIGDHFYAEGVIVGMSAWEVHRSPEAYGKDATTFNPERWLGADKLDLEKYNLAFGAGSRICMGRHISYLEMSKLLPTLVYYYDMEFQRPEVYDVAARWFVTQDNMPTRITLVEH